MSTRPYSSVAAVRTGAARNTAWVQLAGCALLFFFLLRSGSVAAAADMEITPFGSFNQSPLVQIYGIPHDTGADIVPPGTFRIGLNLDLSSNYTVNSSVQEQVSFDGETCRLAFAARYGIARRVEVGVEIPYIIQGGGFLDGFIVDWHTTFGLPQGGRNTSPKDRLLYRYSKDGTQKLQMDRSGSGVGDITLTGGLRLYEERNTGLHDSLALKGAVKLPTGDSSYLFGSGSTDVMLQLCGSMNRFSEWGSLGIYGSAGVLVMSESTVLRDQHKPVAGVGTLGFGWGPASWISFKAQFNATTPLYQDSALAELSGSPILLILGGALKLPGEYLLDIGVAEDVAVGTAPDVNFHFGLSKRF